MAEDTEFLKRPTFGARYLNSEDPNLVYQHNVWDDIKWDSEQEETARKRVEKQAEQKIPESEKEQLMRGTVKHWDGFYNVHQNRFFKDRHWLFTEFPELGGEIPKPDTPIRVFPTSVKQSTVAESSDASSKIQETKNLHSVANLHNKDSVKSDLTLESVEQVENMMASIKTDEKQCRNYLEIGCGVGNTVFPILEYNIDPNLFVYCCDFSKNAVEILKSNKDYDPSRCHAFVCDVTADDWNTPFPPASVDIITLIFALSAIHPERMEHVVTQVYNYLKPGGLVLFRDYGRYDMAQLRFKQGQMMEDNFYVRKDGTFVYFFTQEEVKDLFNRCGFHEEQSHVDRRLQINRSRQLKMYRVWLQAKYRKPLSS